MIDPNLQYIPNLYNGSRTRSFDFDLLNRHIELVYLFINEVSGHPVQEGIAGIAYLSERHSLRQMSHMLLTVRPQP